ncbi:hypothetical protein ABF87_08380 [Nitrosomonas sp. JL21]|uniref:calcium-binding protein n=1 Tax=Nitrosomonas sp. JL21 TaxID=153949 RepID=UPI001370DF66|nr:FG-GAP-like repeat-containing protein [Nitrosomonas sp. JL21]MBL8498857.1 VCBS repeat-containing protein [Nitrosomonas sp.]MXS77975.1 hypothetical protein [Nitrosomonas sp. JL21]
MAQSDPVFSYVGVNPFGLSDVGNFAAPTLVDIDGDRDLDAFVGNGDGNTLFFKNGGSINDSLFNTPITNPFGITDVTDNANPTFVDVDGDNDLDAFIGNTEGNTLFFRNIGTFNTPFFASPVTNPFGLVDVGSYATPSLVDIDGDGDFDAFIGSGDGSVEFLRNIGTASTPTFSTPQTNPFGLNYISRYTTINFVDIDEDGDFDAFVSWYHYFGTGGTWFFRNVGTQQDPVFYRHGLNPFHINAESTYTNLTFADIDGDGDLDIFEGTYFGNTSFFKNEGTGSSENFSFASFHLPTTSYDPIPTFVDIDGDGDLDVFVGQSYSYPGDPGGDTLFFENIGTTTQPIFDNALTNPFGLIDVGSFAAPTFVDIDNDGDKDAFIGNETGNILFFENSGTAAIPLFNAPIFSPFGLSGTGFNAKPVFADIDADNDQDIFVNNNFFENIGTNSIPIFAEPVANSFGLNGSDFDFKDVDDDGDLDSLGFNGSFFRNIGTSNIPLFSSEANPLNIPEPGGRSSLTGQAFVDIDGDGDLDVYVMGMYWYASSFAWDEFLINNHAPNVVNLTIPEVYTKNNPLNLKDVIVTDPDSTIISVSLTLSNSAAGKLNTATSGGVTSSYNAATGEWKASGAVANVNALLAGVVFTPATNFVGEFSVNASVGDDIAPALTGTKDFTVMLVSTPGNTVLTGTSSGNNTITYASSTGAVTVSLNITTQQNTGGAGLDTITAVENLIGSAFADNLTGNTTYNILDGRAGNDSLRGWSGADTMIGGTGDDTMYVENTRDAVIEKPNEGIDTVSSTITYTLPVNAEKLILTGGSAINGTGNELANVLTGNNADNQLNGQAGNDTLNGGGGNDTLTGWSGADTMIGGLRDDLYFVENVGDVVTESPNQGIDTVSSRLTYTLPANVENLTLTGTTAINGTGNGLANIITGNSADNPLNGGAGNDMLDGGLGANRLTGGAGNDIFKFTSMGPVDVITDYQAVNDTIQLENSVFTALAAPGTLAAGQFRIGAQALDANDHVIYNSVTGALIYDANGNGAGGATQIAAVGTGLALTSADIVVI